MVDVDATALFLVDVDQTALFQPVDSRRSSTSVDVRFTSLFITLRSETNFKNCYLGP